MNETRMSSSKTVRGDRIIWGILIGGAFLLRALFTTARMVLSGDEVHYAESLHLFMQGRIIEGFSDYWSFFYPLAAVPFGLLYGDAETGLRLLSTISGTALLVPCMLMAKSLWGGRSALFVGLLAALHTNLLAFSSAAMTESFYSLLLMLALLFFMRRVREGGGANAILAGLMLGLAYLARQEAQFILFLFVLILLVGKGGIGVGGPARKRFAGVLLLVIFYAIPIIPYSAVLHEKTGRWQMGSKASVNLSSPLVWEGGLERERYVYSLDEDGVERRIEEIGKKNPLEILWRQKGAIAARYFEKFSRGTQLVPLLLVTPFLLVLVPIGLFGRKWGDKGPETMLLLVGLLPFILYPIFHIEIRYLVPYLPIYIMWGGVGCAVITKWLGENTSRGALVAALLLFVVFFSLVPYSVRRYAGIRRGQTLEYREVGRWIRERCEPGARILAPPGTSYSYYAGNPAATFIPWTDTDGLLGYARRHRFDYLVLDERYIIDSRPMLEPLLNDEGYPGLDRVMTFSSAAGGMVMLFRIDGVNR
jgi:4-amino-4-deoxy-L-arabinose transferase-like glycosyltransferase